MKNVKVRSICLANRDVELLDQVQAAEQVQSKSELVRRLIYMRHRELFGHAAK